jgi:hypothetical protein
MRSGPLTIMVLLALGIAASPAILQAQETAFGYAFAGPTSGIDDRPLAWTIGGGGEMITGWRGTSVGLEAGVLWSPALETDGRFPQSITDRLFSVNVSRHFHKSPGFGQWEPFLTGGMFIVAGGDAAQGGFTIGGGVHRWFTRHAGVRIDVRDQFLPGAISLVGVRAGIVFR